MDQAISVESLLDILLHFKFGPVVPNCRMSDLNRRTYENVTGILKSMPSVEFIRVDVTQVSSRFQLHSVSCHPKCHAEMPLSVSY